MKLLLISFIYLFSFSSFSSEQNKVTYPDTVMVKNKTLLLNGIGTRKATWFKVKVYVGALYLEKKSKDVNKFLSNKSPKQIQMTFVRDVDAKKLKDGWTEAFKKRDNYQEIKVFADKFNSYMPDVKKGMKFKITFLPDKVITEIDNKTMEDINSALFSKALLSVWFINAGDEGLRDGLLGL